MVVVSKELLNGSPPFVPLDAHNAFVGEWLLDRVNGLVDAEVLTIRRVRIDERALTVDLRCPRSPIEHAVIAELNGDSIELRHDNNSCTVQALLEGDGLVWEVDCQAGERCTRVRRVMHSSKQRSQLVAERVDMNAEGTPIGLRT